MKHGRLKKLVNRVESVEKPIQKGNRRFDNRDDSMVRQAQAGREHSYAATMGNKVRFTRKCFTCGKDVKPWIVKKGRSFVMIVVRKVQPIQSYQPNNKKDDKQHGRRFDQGQGSGLHRANNVPRLETSQARVSALPGTLEQPNFVNCSKYDSYI